MKKPYIALVALALFGAGCESSLVTDPTASIDSGTALSTERGISLGVNGAYRSLMSGNLWGLYQLAYADLYADNLDFTGTFQTDREFSLRAVTPSNGTVTGIWASAYAGIDRANNIIAAVPKVGNMDAANGAQYLAEAHFIRALHYYVLVSWFGGVPLVTEPSSGVGPEALVSRATAAEVWARIEADLQAAATGLPPTAKGRASQAGVAALRARVYLEQGKYAQARDAATTVISNTSFRLMPVFKDIWSTKHSAESIFELTYTVNSSNSLAFWYFPQALGGRWGYAPTAAFHALYEPTDQRRAVTVGVAGTSRYGNKYTRIANGDDNVVVLRLAEMYLIRAEANARLGAAADVVRADINAVRQRAGATPLDATVATQTQLLDAVLAERRLELAQEGHRFFDLRRHGKATTVLAISNEKLILPIPQAERDVNPNLVQNPGY